MADKTKVLIVVDGLWHRSGVTSVIMNYYRNLDLKKIQMDFLLFEGGKNDEDLIGEVQDEGSKIYYVPSLGAHNIYKFIKSVDTFFAQHKKYKIVHSHLCFIDSLVFPLAKKHGVKYCISHSHNTKFSDYRIRAIRNKLMCMPITKVADFWFACSEAAGEVLYGKRFKRSSKAKVINNAINCKGFNYNEEIRKRKREELGLENKKVIGYVGRLNPQKNVGYFLNVFQLFIKKNQTEDCMLLIVGAGPLEQDLKTQVQLLGISNNVNFLGQRNDVEELMQAMDVFVLPSLYEGLPVVMVEAQIAGLPCVASNQITKEVGLSKRTVFVPIGNKDFDNWVFALKTALSLPRSSGLNLAQQKGYDIKMEAKKLEDFYISI